MNKCEKCNEDEAWYYGEKKLCRTCWHDGITTHISQENKRLEKENKKLKEQLDVAVKRLKSARKHICDMCMSDEGCEDCEWEIKQN